MRILFLCLLLGSVAACQRAEQPGADAALVILQFAEVPAGAISRTFTRSNVTVPIGQAAFSLVLSRYGADGQIAGNNFGEVTLSTDKAEDGLVGRAIRPGSYVVTRFVEAERWGECFGKSSWRFDVAPGQVVYLGALNAQRHTADLMRAAVAANRAVLSGPAFGGERYVWYGNTTPPLFRPTDPVLWMQPVAAYAHAHFPDFTAAPQPARLQPATFSMNGKLENMGIPSCGSMFY